MKAGNPMLRVSQLAGAGGARGWGWRGEKRVGRSRIGEQLRIPSLVTMTMLAGNMTRLAHGTSVGTVQERLKRADVFCFDVDSTLITSESIVELAKCKGVQDQVAQLTRSAMNGELSFHEALARRMALMRPTRRDVADMTAGDSIKLTPNVKRLFEALRARKKSIFLLTGGFWELIDPLARDLGLSREQVYCNSLLFDEAGSYLGFDSQAWTATQGGKKRAVEHIRELTSSTTIVMIGDGATDLEARDVGDGKGGADLFVGYGGVEVRKRVQEKADWFIRDFSELVAAVEGE